MAKHRETHRTPVEGCFGCHLLSVNLAPSAQGSQRAQSSNSLDKQWNRDMAAYRRLRHEGLQPKQIDGCGDLETRATSQDEIERGHLFKNKAEKKRVDDAFAAAQEMGA